MLGTDFVQRRSLRIGSNTSSSPARNLNPKGKVFRLVFRFAVSADIGVWLVGMIEVRIEFLSERAKVTASSSQPCIMLFKSQPAHPLVWLWKRTVFVWISIIMFLTELMFALVFCRPIITPRGKPRIPYIY
ncbi:hypothetical protein SADUNF_Sadunf16G0254300 [Salix dunnii]|uniref:Uncharacterized protein n=1 Tax=Salix dunnii TaxID=1413687 RepID=A0A835MR84_9ROSI|nr:hypothetical protein SADUNF_Sadunf16G0254300 [Salix dunnii]